MKTCFLKRNFLNLKFKFISPNVDGEMVKRQLNLYFSESNHDKASLTGKSQNVQICNKILYKQTERGHFPGKCHQSKGRFYKKGFKTYVSKSFLNGPTYNMGLPLPLNKTGLTFSPV